MLLSYKNMLQDLSPTAAGIAPAMPSRRSTASTWAPRGSRSPCNNVQYFIKIKATFPRISLASELRGVNFCFISVDLFQIKRVNYSACFAVQDLLYSCFSSYKCILKFQRWKVQKHHPPPSPLQTEKLDSLRSTRFCLGLYEISPLLLYVHVLKVQLKKARDSTKPY